MTQVQKVLYTAHQHTEGNRDGGHSRSSDGRLDVHFTPPGVPGTGTNPEQLLAAGWSACFIGAMARAAGKMKLALPAHTAVDAEIDLCLTGDAFSLQARLHVHLPGMEPSTARAVADGAHQICPYSKALRGNIDIAIQVA